MPVSKHILKLCGAALACTLMAETMCAQTIEIEFPEKTPFETFEASLRAAIGKTETPKSRLEARRQVKRAARLASDLLNSEAYFRPNIETGIAMAAPFQTILKIDPGPRYDISEVIYDYSTPLPDEADRALIDAKKSIKPGQIAIPEQILVEQSRLKRSYLDLGYADIEVASPGLLADEDEASTDVTFPIQTGHIVMLGEIEIVGAERTRRSYINRLRGYEPGALYSPGALNGFAQRLSSTRHFEQLTVNLKPIDPEKPDALRPVIVELEERPRNTLALGASVATDQGIGALAEWTRWNLTGRADRLVLGVQASTIEQSISAGWRLPHFPRTGQEITARAEVFNEITDAFDRTGATLGGLYELASFRNVVLTFGGELELVNERGAAEDRFLQTLTFAAGARIDKTNNLFDPTRGWRAAANVQPGFSFGDDTSQFVRISTQATTYTPLSSAQTWVFANRLEAGSVLGADLLSLPVGQRFFSGGGASVRGFGFQEVGPRGADGEPLGGRSFFEASSELRVRATKRFGFAAFVDAGSISSGLSPDFGDTRIGAGAGLRINTPAGPIRLDFATPLNPTEFDRSFQFYFSIGQAF